MGEEQLLGAGPGSWQEVLVELCALAGGTTAMLRCGRKAQGGEMCGVLATLFIHSWD